MAEFSLPGLTASSPEELAKLNKTLNWLLNNLDHNNVTHIYTEYCDIQSENGETIIDGPLLVMTGNSTTVRLKQGYDKASGAFVFNLYNSAGTLTVGIDSSGNAEFRGTVTGSIIQTSTAGARIVMSTNDFVAYDSNGIKRVAINPTTGAGVEYYDLGFYNELGNRQGMVMATSGMFYIVAYNDLYVTATTVMFGNNVQIGGNVGFFGGPTAAKIAVSNLSTAATLGGTIDKLNNLIDSLQAYNLV